MNDFADLFGGGAGSFDDGSAAAPEGLRPAHWPWGDLAPRAYDVIVADPPWRFELHNETTGGAKSPQAHYRCLDMADIARLPVGLLARPNALLFLWCTWPMLATGEQIALARAWGFAPVSGGSWAKRTASGKLRWGPGYVVRTGTEPYLIAVDEACCPYLVAKVGEGARNPSLINHVDGLARENSRKPDEFYAALAAATPGRRRCDLFARETRPGFDGWGDQADKFDGQPEPMA